jgi:HTH-type transcriptional regulator/antitoxin HigA
LGIPAESLIQSEPASDAASASEPSKPVLKMLADWGMLRRGESYSAFLARACGGAPAAVMLRKTRTERTNAKTDSTALQAWCACVLSRSNTYQVAGAFDAQALSLDVVRHIASFSTREDGPLAVRSVFADLGIAFVVVPHLPGTHLDGAAMRRSDGRPVVALSLRHDRIDNFWFTLLHELAHVYKHLSDDTHVIFDDLDLKSTELREREADDLAQVALLPEELWIDARLNAYASTTQILELAELANVNPAIVAGRWQREFKDFRKFSRLLGRGTLKPLFASDLP